MKKINRIFALLIVIVLAFNLCACNNDASKTKKKTIKEEILEDAVRTEHRLIGERIIGENKVYTDTGFSNSEDVADDEITEGNDEFIIPMTDNLIEQNYFSYRLIRSSTSSDAVSIITAALNKKIKANLGCNTIYKTDSVKANPKQRELIIGLSNRQSSVTAENMLRKHKPNCYYDAVVTTVGNDICIFGYELDALLAATDHFLDTFCNGKVKKVPTNYTWYYTSNKSLTGVTIGDKNISNYRIIIPSNPSELILGTADLLQKTVESVAGVPIDIAYDSVGAVENEIQIGNTNRNMIAILD